MSKQILNPDHPKWGEFYVGMMCNSCMHDTRNAKALLNEIGGIDVDRTMEFFKSHGGFCDCEIILNVLLGCE